MGSRSFAAAMSIEDEFEKLREKSSQPGSTSMTHKQMSIEVLGKRSGYLKGFGRPSSSSRSTGRSMQTLGRCKPSKMKYNRSGD